jgi:hypothetical protein
MALLQQAKVAVVAGFAVGMMVTLASGDLRADRVSAELERANERLSERLADQEVQLAAALEQIDALRTATGDTKPGPTKPGGTSGKTAAQAAAEEKAAFRAKALVALAPELEAIATRSKTIEATAAAAKSTFENHNHEVEFMGHGWVKVDTMLESDHLDVVRKVYHQDFVAVRGSHNSKYMKATTKPK